MQRFLMIRTYGDMEATKAVLPTMETAEMRRLKEKVEFSERARQNYWRKKIMESKIKYAVRPRSPLADNLLGIAGFLVLLVSGGLWD